MVFGIKINPFTPSGIPSVKLRIEVDLVDLVRNCGIPSLNYQMGFAGGRIFKIFLSGSNAVVEAAQYAVCHLINAITRNAIGLESANAKKGTDKKSYLDRSFELIKLAAITASIVGLTQLMNDPTLCANVAPLIMITIAVILIAVHALPSRKNS